jgi:hypothetical protein
VSRSASRRVEDGVLNPAETVTSVRVAIYPPSKKLLEK